MSKKEVILTILVIVFIAMGLWFFVFPAVDRCLKKRIPPLGWVRYPDGTMSLKFIAPPTSIQAVNEPNIVWDFWEDVNMTCTAIAVVVDIDPNIVKEFAEQNKLCDNYTDFRITLNGVEKDFTLEEFRFLLGFDLEVRSEGQMISEPQNKMIFERRVSCMGFMDMNTKRITMAKLDDGRIVEYNACADLPDAYDPNNFKFIGKGIIYSVNNVMQNSDQQQCFFVKLF